MATLNENRLRKKKKKKIVIWSLLTACEVFIAPWLVYLLHQVLTVAKSLSLGHREMEWDFSYITSWSMLLQENNMKLFFIVLQLLWLVFVIYCEMDIQPVISQVDEQKITDYISIPVPAGNGQHGNERFLTSKEKEEIYDVFEFSGKEQLQGKGGVVVHYEKEGKKEKMGEN